MVGSISFISVLEFCDVFCSFLKYDTLFRDVDSNCCNLAVAIWLSKDYSLFSFDIFFSSETIERCSLRIYLGSFSPLLFFILDSLSSESPLLIELILMLLYGVAYSLYGKNFFPLAEPPLDLKDPYFCSLLVSVIFFHI